MEKEVEDRRIELDIAQRRRERESGTKRSRKKSTADRSETDWRVSQKSKETFSFVQSLSHFVTLVAFLNFSTLPCCRPNLRIAICS